VSTNAFKMLLLARPVDLPAWWPSDGWVTLDPDLDNEGGWSAGIDEKFAFNVPSSILGELMAGFLLDRDGEPVMFQLRSVKSKTKPKNPPKKKPKSAKRK